MLPVVFSGLFHAFVGPAFCVLSHMTTAYLLPSHLSPLSNHFLASSALLTSAFTPLFPSPICVKCACLSPHCTVGHLYLIVSSMTSSPVSAGVLSTPLIKTGHDFLFVIHTPLILPTYTASS